MRYKWLMLAALEAAALGFAAGGADARVGQRCGGTIQITCGAGEWCDPIPGHCKPGARGHCVQVPQVCFDLFKPVCGCNGRTYSNDCWRQMSKEPKKHNGQC
jgi:Kazal-type serine protease inhibitor domain